MKKFFVGLLHFLLTLVLLFFTVGMLWAIYALPLALDRDRIVVPALLGFGGGLLFFTLVSRILILYVFGHELTHWFAAKFFFRDTGEVKVGTSGGSVAVHNPNIWITLAPYFIPFYTLIWIGIYGIFRFGYGPPNATVFKILYGGIGLTYAFHAVLTMHSLMREQADLKQHGYLMSLTLILCVNVAILLAGLLTATHQWHNGTAELLQRTRLEWDGVVEGCSWVYDRGSDGIDWIRDRFF